MRILIPFLMLAGCTTVSQPETFVLPQGEVVVCLRYEQEACGIALRKCGTDYTVDFECMQGIKYVGPGEHPTVPADYAPGAQ